MEQVKDKSAQMQKRKTAPASAGAAQFQIGDFRLEGSVESNSNILLLDSSISSTLVAVDNIQSQASDLPTTIGDGEDIAKVVAVLVISGEPAQGDGTLAENLQVCLQVNDLVGEDEGAHRGTISNGTEEEALCSRDEEGIVDGNRMSSKPSGCVSVTGDKVNSVGLDNVGFNVVEVATSLVVVSVAVTSDPLGSDFRENVASQEPKGEIGTVCLVVSLTSIEPVQTDFEPVLIQEAPADAETKHAVGFTEIVVSESVASGDVSADKSPVKP